ncbi:putative Light-harvesting LHII; alpha subunit B / Histone protein [Paratrimastix pyriformis]|uniref:Light-harvesting LHII n=1 Tax=Paratrimastix pyriformis TaxID=342808 RepID=A0ABQ8UCE8_9EUKA|nr:putative Light-harvesting LHII; alpha subunit B / Histone protein [Paratrimastix pyriformis]
MCLAIYVICILVDSAYSVSCFVSSFVRTYAVAGNTIRVVLQASERLASGYRIAVPPLAASTWTVSGSTSNPILTATVTLPASGVPQGPLNYTATVLCDTIGNCIAAPLVGMLGITYDTVPPLLLTVTATSDRPANPALALANDTVAGLFPFDEALNQTMITTDDVEFNGHSVDSITFAADGRSFEARYRFRDGADLGGLVNWTLATGCDLAGNCIDPASGTFTVRFNGTAPALVGDVTAVTDIVGHTTMARPGTAVTLSFETTRVLAASPRPTATIMGHVATLSCTAGMTCQATATMASGDTDGPVDYAIQGEMCDLGDDCNTTVGVTGTLAITFDGTPPSLTLVRAVSNNAYSPVCAKDGDGVTVVLQASEPLASGYTIAVPPLAAATWTASGSAASPILTATVTLSDASGVPQGPLNYTATVLCDTIGNCIAAPLAGMLGITYDTVPPLLLTVTATTDHPANPALALTNDTLTGRFPFDEALNQTMITTDDVEFNGHPVDSITYAADGRSFEARYRFRDGDGADLGGLVNWTLATACDLAGNCIDPASGTFTVRFNGTAPALVGDVTAVTDLVGHTTMARPGTAVTLSFETTRVLAASPRPTVTIMGHVATLSCTAQMTCQATATMASGDTDGAVDYAIQGEMCDLGDDCNTTVDVTGTLAITFDGTPPSLTLVRAVSNNTRSPVRAKDGDDVTVVLQASEPLASGYTIAVPPLAAATWTASGPAASPILTATVTLSDASGVPQGPLNYTATVLCDAIGNCIAAPLVGMLGVTYDSIAPSLLTVSATTTNAHNTSWAKWGDTITAQFTFDVALNQSSVSDLRINGYAPSSALTFAADGTSFAATLALTAGMQMMAGGMNWTLATACDLAGNCLAAESGSLGITLSTQAPSLVSRTLANTNPRSNRAKPGDTLTLTLTISADLDPAAATQPTVTISGRCDSLAVQGTKVRATVVMGPSDPEGLVMLQAGGQLCDMAGNCGTLTIASTSSGVTYDRTAPTLLSASATSSNPRSQFLAKSGDQATGILTFSETVMSLASFRLLGRDADEFGDFGDALVMAGFTMPTGAADAANVSMEIGAFCDKAGNCNPGGITRPSAITYYGQPMALSFSSASSTNDLNSTLAVAANEVRVTLVSNNPLTAQASITATMAGRDVSLLAPAGGRELTGILLVESTDTQGPIAFEMSNVCDVVGQCASLAGLLNISIDTVYPTVLSVTAFTDLAANTTVAKAGSRVHVTLVASEPLGRTSQLVVSIGGVFVAREDLQVVPGATVVEGSVVLGSQTTAGPVTVAYAMFCDLAGNCVTRYNWEGLPMGVTFVTPPTISQVRPALLTQTGGLIAIHGDGFRSPVTVTVAGQACPVQWSNETRVLCQAPAGVTPGDAALVLTDYDTTTTGTVQGMLAYQSVVTLTSITPAVGPQTGSLTLCLTGTGLAMGTGPTVTVGGHPCVVYLPRAATTAVYCELTVSGAANGLAEVVVTNPDGGHTAMSGAFLFQGPSPVLAAGGVQPAVGPIEGGTVLTLNGTGLRAGASVMLDGGSMATQLACLDVTLVGTNDTTLNCTTPAGITPGPIDLVVTNTDGTSTRLVDGFTYQGAAPVIANITPPNGTRVGGTTITITGSGFRAGITATIAGNPCTGLVVVSVTQITCVTPAGVEGLAVMALGNTDGTRTQANFTYFVPNLPPPLFTSVTPSQTKQTASARLVIRGSNLLPGITVTVGGLTCASPVLNTARTTVTCTLPAPGPALYGPYDVVLTNPNGGVARGVGKFTVTGTAPPAVTGVAPTTGSATGSTAVTISGSGFAQGATATVGGTNCTGAAVSSDGTSLTCTVGASAAATATTRARRTDSNEAGADGVAPGPAAVVVTNPDGQSSAGSGNATAGAETGGPVIRFFFQAGAPVLSAVAPATGPTNQGTPIWLTVPSNLRPGATVTLGGQPCLHLTQLNATALTCYAPPASASVQTQLEALVAEKGLAGARVAVDVVVVNADLTQATLSEAFGYTPAVAVGGSSGSLSATGTALISVGASVLVLVLLLLPAFLMAAGCRLCRPNNSSADDDDLSVSGTSRKETAVSVQEPAAVTLVTPAVDSYTAVAPAAAAGPSDVEAARVVQIGGGQSLGWLVMEPMEIVSYYGLCGCVEMVVINPVAVTPSASPSDSPPAF